MIELRDYQKECLEVIKNKKSGSYLIQMATGMGKTVTFSQLNYNKLLIISHREELVHQPKKYFTDKRFSVEMGKNRADMRSDVISASIASLVRRYKNFNPKLFDVIVIDEAHHAAAKTYRKVIDYFKPNLLLGFTATPNRADQTRLDDVFSEIIFKRDLLWGIKNNYLSNVKCKRVYVKYDLHKVKTTKGDYNVDELENELIKSENPKSIGSAYKEHAKGQTLIFGLSVKHCEEIQKEIPGSVLITAKTKDRSKIIDDFTNRKIKVLINCMIFTEGTDLPLIETIIVARPTKNDSLYVQMVGRGLRLSQGKTKLLLIDCVGVSTDLNLCTAPTLLGITYNDKEIDKNNDSLECDLFELPDEIEKRTDTPENWKINYKEVNLWSKKQGYKLHNVNWYKNPNGSFTLSLKDRILKASAVNELGQIECNGKTFEAQNFFDKVYKRLLNSYEKEKYIWDISISKKWGRLPATSKQLDIIKKRLPNFDYSGLTKLQGSQILNRLFNK